MALRSPVSDGALAYLPGADYADAFEVPTAVARPARTWAGSCLGSGAAVADRTFHSVVWHGLLGFDLAEPGDTVAGWRIALDEPDRCVPAVDGHLMTGCIVFEVRDGRVTWTTMLRFCGVRGRLVWSVLQHVHRALAAQLLRRAARRGWTRVRGAG